MTDTRRIPVAIDLRPYLLDHAVEGGAVLPAVEAMEVLAATVRSWRPETDVRRLSSATFDKFLYLPAGGDRIDALVDFASCTNGDIAAELLTRARPGRTRIARLRSHVRLRFSPSFRPAARSPAPPQDSLATDGPCVYPERIYRELVPFGPAYHNIAAPLLLGSDGAIVSIRAPELDGKADGGGELGSPFVLDAAFHAACVWGQCFAGVVAFPVALEERVVIERTRPGAVYSSRIVPTGNSQGDLRFDLWISEKSGRVMETVRGVRMRDVSGGRMKPPQWIQKGVSS